MNFLEEVLGAALCNGENLSFLVSPFAIEGVWDAERCRAQLETLKMYSIAVWDGRFSSFLVSPIAVEDFQGCWWCRLRWKIPRCWMLNVADRNVRFPGCKIHMRVGVSLHSWVCRGVSGTCEAAFLLSCDGYWIVLQFDIFLEVRMVKGWDVLSWGQMVQINRVLVRLQSAIGGRKALSVEIKIKFTTSGAWTRHVIWMLVLFG